MWKRSNAPSVDREPLMCNENNGDWTALDVETGTVQENDASEKSARYFKPPKICTRTYVVGHEAAPLLPELVGNVVFPAGIFYKSICNPNSFAVEIVFTIGQKHSYRVCLEPSSACCDVEVLPSPGVNAPMGRRWSESFGVITRELLDRGIVETRENGDRVVWRKFRHSPTKFTPYGIWCEDGGNCRYTVIGPDDYEKLVDSCVALSTDSVLIAVRPLLSNTSAYVGTTVSMDMRFPYLYSGSPVSAVADDRV